MEPYVIVLISIISAIILLIILMDVIATIILKKTFVRLNFEEDKEFISFKNIKNECQRERFEFKSKNNILKAYLYSKNESDKLVVYVHGMCAGHQCYLSDIISLMNRGYNVFTYDFTATGESDGKNYIGLNQQYFDLRNAIKFLKEKNMLGYKSIYLYGHSMGGYAVATINDNIFNKIVSISGFDNHINALVNVFPNKNKIVRFILKIMLKIKYFISYGFKGNVKCHNILKKTNVKTLIIHGNNDELVDFKNISIYSKKNKINNDNVTYLELSDENHNGHNTLIASTECVLYQKERLNIYNKILEETKDKAKARKAMIEGIDIFKMNSANEELMDIIDRFYKE